MSCEKDILGRKPMRLNQADLQKQDVVLDYDREGDWRGESTIRSVKPRHQNQGASRQARALMRNGQDDKISNT